jgi:alpha-beta hydrolase superfamily lysophospholipase
MLGESLAWFPSLVKKLVASGSAVFIYDRRGTGLSSVVKNLPFHRHVQDAITIYRFMKMIPSVNADSIIILGVGTGSYAAQKIASSTIPPWAVAFLYPPLPNYLAYWETKEGETSDFSKIVANLNAKRSTSVTALTERNGRNIWLASNPAELKDLSNIDFMDSLSAIPCETVIIMSAGESILAKKCEKSGVKVVETTAQQNLSDAVLSWLLEISRPAETK